MSTPKLKTFTREEWQKDTTQPVYFSDGRKIDFLTFFPSWDVFQFAGRIDGTNCVTTFIPDQLRLAQKWELAPPPWGAWHNAGYFREGDLAEGERPLMVGEEKKVCDVWENKEHRHAWTVVGGRDGGLPFDDFIYKTRRPLPDQKPEPVFRDLTPEDSPPGTVFHLVAGDIGYRAPMVVSKEGIIILRQTDRHDAPWYESITWAELRTMGATYLRPGGQWQPCKVEVKS